MMRVVRGVVKMKALKWLAVVVSACMVILTANHVRPNHYEAAISESNLPPLAIFETNRSDARSSNSATVRYRLDASRSKFIAHALAGGLLWFKGHDHLIAVREFTGEAQFSTESITASSLEIVAKTASMEETSSVFTEPQKQIINKELREIVLLPDQYPDIVFRSTSVTGKSIGNDQYDLKIAGNLTLHGVTRPITIPTKVTVTGNDLRAVGEFSIDRSDFKVKATSAMHGMIRVRNKVKFEFDIVGHRL
jgi:polyisoprenoid-binding protein YceI